MCLYILLGKVRTLSEAADVGWIGDDLMSDGVGDTPYTVMTTKAPAVLTN